MAGSARARSKRGVTRHVIDDSEDDLDDGIETLETIEDVEETAQGAPLLPARLISKRGGGEVRLAEEL